MSAKKQIQPKQNFKAKAAPIAIPKIGSTNENVSKWLPLVILICTMLFVIIIRLRLLDIPLERDEGEYAYAGQELLKGIPPFRSVHHVKLPGVYGIYAIFLFLFGHSAQAIRMGLLICNLSDIFFCYLIGKKLFNALTGASAAFVFALITLTHSLFGFTANTEHFILLFLLPGFLLLLYTCDMLATKDKRLIIYSFFTGLLIGFAYIMKQQTIYFVIFAAAYYIYRGISARVLNKGYFYINGIIMAITMALPLGIMSLIFKRLGLLNTFWWWTFYYPRTYESQVSFADGMGFLSGTMHNVIPENWPLLLLMAIGMVIIIIQKKIPYKIFVLGWFVVGMLAASTGLYFYNHYFILSAPVVGLLAAIAINSITGLGKKINLVFLQKWGAAIIIIIVFLCNINIDKQYYFSDEPEVISRKVYSGNPFPESPKIGEYIEQHSTPNDKIVVMGSEPQIYFYANRSAATGFIYTYEMERIHPYAIKFQHQMVEEIEAAKPKFIVWVNLSGSWFVVSVKDADKYLIDWANKYIQDNYEQVGIVNILFPKSFESTMVFDSPDKKYNQDSPSNLIILKRKGT